MEIRSLRMQERVRKHFPFGSTAETERTMRKTIATAGLLALGIGLASSAGTIGIAAAGAAPSKDVPLSGRECLYLDRVNGFNPGGPNRIYVEGSGRDVYEFETTEVCPNLNFSLRVA
jgi:hypothetical protein